MNDLFFKLTNSGQYPDHVTVAPVVADGQCIAMLVGCCKSDMSKQITLNRIEDQASLFATGLLRFINPASKAG